MIQFGLKQEDIDKINDVFASYEGIDSVVIYGSELKGTLSRFCIDLTIIDNSLTFQSFFK
jgi:hypothetical protein